MSEVHLYPSVIISPLFTLDVRSTFISFCNHGNENFENTPEEEVKNKEGEECLDRHGFAVLAIALYRTNMLQQVVSS